MEVWNDGDSFDDLLSFLCSQQVRYQYVLLLCMCMCVRVCVCVCVCVFAITGAQQWAQPAILDEATTHMSVLLNLPLSNSADSNYLFRYSLARGFPYSVSGKSLVKDGRNTFTLSALTPDSSYSVWYTVFNVLHFTFKPYSSKISFTTPSLGRWY